MAQSEVEKVNKKNSFHDHSKTAENLKKIGLLFFIILGIGHIISGLMMTNNYFLPWSSTVNQILTLPFAMTAIIYGVASISTNLKDGEHKNLNRFLIIVSLLIFVSLVYIGFLVPNK